MPEQRETPFGLVGAAGGHGNPAGRREQVGRIKTGAHGAVGLRADKQPGCGRVHRRVPAVEQGRALAALVAGNRQREVSFRGYVRDEGTQPGEQRVFGRLLLAQGIALGAQCRDFVGVDGDEQLAAIRAAPSTTAAVRRAITSGRPPGKTSGTTCMTTCGTFR